MFCADGNFAVDTKSEDGINNEDLFKYDQLIGSRNDMENTLEKQKNSTNIDGVQYDKIGSVENFFLKPGRVILYNQSEVPYPDYLAFKWDDDLGKSYHELSYKNQRFRAEIREKELRALASFIESDENFKISAITGAAGSGKSGLIYNFCKKIEIEQKWSVYGVTYEALIDSINDELVIRTKGEKEERILLVVDYVLVNAEEIGNWIKRLRKQCKDIEDLKIRILLIERASVGKERKPFWYMKSIEKKQLEDVCDTAGFIELDQLPDEALEDIFVSYVKEHAEENDVRECAAAAHEIMERIEENTKTPLFVKCIADAWLEDKNCRKKRWGKEGILSYMIAKEDVIIRNVLSTSEKSESLMKIIVYAMALSGINIGTNMPECLKTDFAKLREEFGSGKPNLSHLFTEFGKVDEQNMRLKLAYPDILEELFCLEYLKTIRFDSFDSAFVKEFIEQAWAIDSKAFAAFLYRSIEDFPNHKMVSCSEILQKPSNMQDETRVLYADVLREYTYWKENEDETFEKIIEVFRQLINETGHDQARDEIYEKFAVALFNMAEIWSRKRIEEKKKCKYLKIMQTEICRCRSDAYIDYIFKNALAVVRARRNKAINKGAISIR